MLGFSRLLKSHSPHLDFITFSFCVWAGIPFPFKLETTDRWHCVLLLLGHQPGEKNQVTRVVTKCTSLPSSPSISRLLRSFLHVLQTWPWGDHLYPPSWTCSWNTWLRVMPRPNSCAAAAAIRAQGSQCCCCCCLVHSSCSFATLLFPGSGAPARILDDSDGHSLLLSNNEHCGCTRMFHCQDASFPRTSYTLPIFDCHPV